MFILIYFVICTFAVAQALLLFFIGLRVRCYLQLKLGEGAVHDYLCASAAAFYFNVKDPGPQLSHSLSFVFLFFSFFNAVHSRAQAPIVTRIHTRAQTLT